MANFNIDYLIVAGGGGGGSYGGGGAGGFLTNFPSKSLSLNTSTAYSITIGGGGSGSGNSYTAYGVQGSDSSISGTGISTITATGGGYGGNNTGSGAGAASAGGSGGGGSDGPTNSSGGAGNTPSTTPSQGNTGGSGTFSDPNYMGGGGGGAGAAGSNATIYTAGYGGAGSEVNIIGGVGNYYAGGGGGVRFNVSGSWGYGGTGGGGDGGSWNATTSLISNNTAGGANTGGGGGAGKEGGSGIVIIRYATADVASYTVTGAAPTEDTTTVAGQTILSFTTVGTGTITFTASPPTPSFSGTKVTTPVTNFNKPLTEEGLKIPSGTSSNQPTGVEGMVRNDTTQSSKGSSSAISYYNGTNWRYFENQEHPLILNSVMYYSASNATSYPGTGTSWFDLSGNANTATITSSNYSNGYFDLTPTGSIITTPVNTLYQTFSFSIWVKFDTVTVASGYAGVVLSKSQFYASNYDAFPFNSSLSLTGNFSVGLSYGNNYSYDVINNTTVSANTWYNIAYVADSTANTAKLYIGTESTQLAQTGSTQSYTGTLVTNPNQFYSLGKSPAEYGGGVGKSSLDGKIAKFGFWDTALTEAELITIWGLGSGTS